MEHTRMKANRARRVIALATIAVVTLFAATAASAQWVTTYEQFYVQAPHNWVFRNNYQAADRLFNAFDYGHAILYERLWTQPNASAALLEEREYDYLTKRVLVRPPRIPLEEAAIEIKYAQLAPEAKQMFDWAHILHRQIYDVLADERLDDTAKDREVQRLIDYYKTRRDLAFSSIPKSMQLMQEQPYSLAFRKQYPKFNGLIWGYHWLQVGLYEPLLVGRTVAERQAGVRGTVARFWQMLQDPPRAMPYQMPMTAAVAPEFTRRYPEAAIIFDNLHSMHDVISDILANDSVPRNRKRAEIMIAARRYRDDTSFVMTREAWQVMAGHMGIENMGGPPVGFLPMLPTATVTYGAVMTHDDRTGAMTGFRYGGAVGDAHGAHGAPAAAGAAPASGTAPGGMSGMQHGNMTGMPSAGSVGGMTGATRPASDSANKAGMQHDGMSHGMMPATGADTTTAMLREMHNVMMRDAVILARVNADTTLRAHQAHLEAMGVAEPAPAGTPGTRRPAGPASRTSPRRQPSRPSQPKPSEPVKKKAPADPRGGHVMPPPSKVP